MNRYCLSVSACHSPSCQASTFGISCTAVALKGLFSQEKQPDLKYRDFKELCVLLIFCSLPVLVLSKIDVMLILYYFFFTFRVFLQVLFRDV